MTCTAHGNKLKPTFVSSVRRVFPSVWCASSLSVIVTGADPIAIGVTEIRVNIPAKNVAMKAYRFTTIGMSCPNPF